MRKTLEASSKSPTPKSLFESKGKVDLYIQVITAGQTIAISKKRDQLEKGDPGTAPVGGFLLSDTSTGPPNGQPLFWRKFCRRLLGGILDPAENNGNRFHA